MVSGAVRVRARLSRRERRLRRSSREALARDKRVFSENETPATRAGDAPRRRARAARRGTDARTASGRRISYRWTRRISIQTRGAGRRRETHPLPERSARSRGRPSPSRGLRRSELRGRERPPSVPTTSPSNSRGARGWRAPPVRLAPPAGPEYDPQGRHGGSDTDGGNNQGLGDQRGFDVIRRASRVPHFVRLAMGVGSGSPRAARARKSIGVDRVDTRKVSSTHRTCRPAWRAWPPRA